MTADAAVTLPGFRRPDVIWRNLKMDINEINNCIPEIDGYIDRLMRETSPLRPDWKGKHYLPRTEEEQMEYLLISAAVYSLLEEDMIACEWDEAPDIEELIVVRDFLLDALEPVILRGRETGEDIDHTNRFTAGIIFPDKDVEEMAGMSDDDLYDRTAAMFGRMSVSTYMEYARLAGGNFFRPDGLIDHAWHAAIRVWLYAYMNQSSRQQAFIEKQSDMIDRLDALAGRMAMETEEKAAGCQFVGEL